VPAARVFPCTNCGMVPLAREVAEGKLRALAAGGALVRRELGGRRLGAIRLVAARLGDLHDSGLDFLEALGDLGIVPRDDAIWAARYFVDPVEALQHLGQAGDDMHGVAPLDVPRD